MSQLGTVQHGCIQEMYQVIGANTVVFRAKTWTGIENMVVLLSSTWILNAN